MKIINAILSLLLCVGAASGQSYMLGGSKEPDAVAVGDLPADGYASTYVNVAGDTMTGNLALPATTGNLSGGTIDLTPADGQGRAIDVISADADDNIIQTRSSANNNVCHFTTKNAADTVASNCFTGTNAYLGVGGGNVGIGTSSPEETLQIGSGSDANIYFKIKTDSRAWKIGLGQVGGDDSFIIQDATASATRLRIDTSGGFGIGTTAPGGEGYVVIKATSATDTLPILLLEDSSGNNYFKFYEAGAVSFGNLGTGNLLSNGPGRMELSSDGSGSNAASIAIISDIAMAAGAEANGFQFAGRNSDTGPAYSIWGKVTGGKENGTDTNTLGYIDFYTNGGSLNRKMRLDSSGNLGIGTSIPATLLDVAGAVQFGSGATKSTFSATGSLTLASGANFTNTSSVTANAFFGNGSALTGVPTLGTNNTWTGTNNFVITMATAAATTAANTVTCPGTLKALTGWCRCTGSTAWSAFLGGPAVDAGTAALGNTWTCDATDATMSCATFVLC